MKRKHHFKELIRVEPLLDKTQLAQRTGTTVRNIESLVRKRLIPVIKLGYRTVRFDWVKVKAALDRLEQKEVR